MLSVTIACQVPSKSTAAPGTSVRGKGNKDYDCQSLKAAPHVMGDSGGSVVEEACLLVVLLVT